MLNEGQANEVGLEQISGNESIGIHNVSEDGGEFKVTFEKSDEPLPDKQQISFENDNPRSCD